MKPGIKAKMEIKQPTLLLIIIFSLLLVSSSTKILYPEEVQGNNSVAHFSTIRVGHGGGTGGSAGGGKGSGGDGTQSGSTSDSGKPYGAGSANINHHRRGDSYRLQASVFLTLVSAIFVTQFSVQVL